MGLLQSDGRFCWFLALFLLSVQLILVESITNQEKTYQLLTNAISGGNPENPGAQLTVNELGVQYGFNLAGHILNNEIMNLNISDLVEKFDDGFINVSNLRITAYNLPKFQRQFEPPRRLTWGLTGAGINIEANWKGSKKIVVQVSGEGTFKAKARRLGISITVNVSSTVDGRPILTDVKCKSNIGKIELYIKGGLTGFLLNVFRNLITTTLKPVLESKVCEIAVNFVRIDVNNKLRTFPQKVPILAGVDLYLALFNEPFLTLNTVNTNHSGRVESFASNSTPFEPRDLNLVFDEIDQKMVSLWVTDYIANALLYHIYTSNYFHIEIDPGTFGRVSCSIMKGEVCLGSIFGDLAKLYSDTSVVHILMKATTVPFVFFVQNKTILYGSGAIILKVYDTNDAQNVSNVFLNIQTSIETEIREAFIENSTLYCILNLTSLKMETGNGDRIANDLWSAFVAFIRPLLQNILSNMFKHGFHLNLIDGVNFYNGRVKFYNRTMLLEADVNYYHEMKPGFVMPDSAHRANFVSISFLLLCFLCALIKSQCYERVV